MNAAYLFDTFGQIDDRWIVEAMPPERRAAPWLRWAVPLAACAAIALLALHPAPPRHAVTTDPGCTVQGTTAAGIAAEGGADCTTEAAHPQEEQSDRGDVPELIGGAYIVTDEAMQAEAAAGYERLMDHFGGTYPEWYGGAYLTDEGLLIVQMVGGDEAYEKEDYLAIERIAGTGRVAFGEVAHSMNELLALQQAVSALPELPEAWTCGIDQREGKVELTLAAPSPALLEALAVLDPDNTAITVVVTELAAAE